MTSFYTLLEKFESVEECNTHGKDYIWEKNHHMDTEEAPTWEPDVKDDEIGTVQSQAPLPTRPRKK